MFQLSLTLQRPSPYPKLEAGTVQWKQRQPPFGIAPSLPPNTASKMAVRMGGDADTTAVPVKPRSHICPSHHRICLLASKHLEWLGHILITPQDLCLIQAGDCISRHRISHSASVSVQTCLVLIVGGIWISTWIVPSSLQSREAKPCVSLG